MLVENVNPNKLHDELLNANIDVLTLSHDITPEMREQGQYIAENTWITFAEGTDMDLVQQIIDAHDPTPLPQPPTAEERLESAEQAIIMLMMEG